MTVIIVDEYVDKLAHDVVRLYLSGDEQAAMDRAADVPEWCYSVFEASIKAAFERYTGL